MNDERNTNGRMSLVTVGGIGIVGTLLGVVAAFLLTHHVAQQGHKFGGAPEPSLTFDAKIVLRDGGKCSQQVAGIRFAYPVLRPHGTAADGDSIDWEGIEGRSGFANAGSPLSVIVEFDRNNSPFASYQFTSGGAKVPTSASGPPVGSAGDYDYSSVTVDGVKCTTWDPGVHVTP